MSMRGGRRQSEGLLRWIITQSDSWRHCARAAPVWASVRGFWIAIAQREGQEFGCVSRPVILDYQSTGPGS